MRKFLSVFLTLAMCISLMACQRVKTVSLSESETAGEVNSSAAETVVTTSSVSSNSVVVDTTAAETSSEKTSTAVPTITSTASSKSATASTAAVTTTSAATAPVTTVAATKKVTITEGLAFAQIAKLLEQNGICTKQELLDTINSYDFSKYPLIAALGSDENRCFKLEGYLFPDTYEFYIDQSPENVLAKFLKNAENKITADYRARATELGYTMDQIITLASIIEKESNSDSQMKTVASVLYNRLNAGQRLECDSSINYIEWYVEDYITGDNTRYNSYYNTYKCSALPKGAICNPGETAIEAALYPETTDYFFFVNDTAGNYYYAVTYEEHLANCKTAGVTPIAS